MFKSYTKFVAVSLLSFSLATAVFAQGPEAGDDSSTAGTAQTSDDYFDWGWIGLLGLLGLAGLLPRKDRSYDRSRNSGSAV